MEKNLLEKVLEKLLKVVQSFHDDSRPCVLVGMNVSEWLISN